MSWSIAMLRLLGIGPGIVALGFSLERGLHPRDRASFLSFQSPVEFLGSFLALFLNINTWIHFIVIPCFWFVVGVFISSLMEAFSSSQNAVMALAIGGAAWSSWKFGPPPTPGPPGRAA